MIALADTRGQNPLHHFAVGSSGKIGPSQWRVIDKVFAGGRNAMPGRIFLEGSEEFLQPAVFVTVDVGSRPNAEFFEIIARRRHAAGMQSRTFAEKGDNLLDLSERN